MAKREYDDDREEPKPEPDRPPKREPEPERLPKRPEPEPHPVPPKDTRRVPIGKSDERPDPLTHVMLEDGNAPPDTGVVTEYQLGPEPPRALWFRRQVLRARAGR